ncbi:MAG: putative bifunctional diguanylate cyclase/phosphodiesterase [Micromonosporaceae bacterium]
MIFGHPRKRDLPRRHTEAELLHQPANQDETTGLLNQRGFHRLLDELVSEHHASAAVFLCDVDNFKRINQALGHRAGDELLGELARRLRAGLPAGCAAARFGGDEFLVLCADVASAGGLETLGRRIAELLHTTVPLRGELIHVSASVGAAMVDGAATTTGEDLLRLADAAMYQAKSQAPGSVQLADTSLRSAINGRLQMEAQLHQALRRDHLRLHYQPIVSRSGEVVIAEALMRWPHPDHGLLPPSAILSAAKDGNLLRDLDRWVLRTALAEAATWPASGQRPVSVAVNLASLLPDDPAFLGSIRQIVAESGIDPHNVVLEIVETAMMGMSDDAKGPMRALIDTGIRFAVDDFGMGESSLSRFRDFPTQIIKLSGRFISRTPPDAVDAAIIRSVIDLARGTGRSAVVEHVATSGQFRLLKQLDFDAYQGFLFSRPLPARDLRTRLSHPWASLPQE